METMTMEDVAQKAYDESYKPTNAAVAASEKEITGIVKVIGEIFKSINDIRMKMGATEVAPDLELTKACIEKAQEIIYSDAESEKESGLGEVWCQGRLDNIGYELDKKIQESLRFYHRLPEKRLTHDSKCFAQVAWASSQRVGMAISLKRRSRNILLKPRVVLVVKFDPPLNERATAEDFMENIRNLPLQDVWMQNTISGLPKGNFLYRCRVKKPGYDPLKGVEAEYFQPGEFYVGSILKMNGFTFQLLSADEYTYKYMEHNSEKFPHADVGKCLKKVREAFGPLEAEQVLMRFAECDCRKQGVASLEDFRCILLELTKNTLSEQEVMTLSRAYECAAPPPGTDWATVQAICQTELRKNNFDKQLLARIKYTFRYHDPCRSGKIDRDTLKATLKGARLPLFKELLEYLVKNWPSDPNNKDCCKVDYCCLLRFLNWEENPAPIAKPAAIQCVMKWVEPQPPTEIFCVNYRAFLEDVCPNFKCALPAVCCCCNQGTPCPLHPGGQNFVCGQGGMTSGAPQAYELSATSQDMTPITYKAQNIDLNAGGDQCTPIEIHVSPCSQEVKCIPPHKCHPDAPHCNEPEEFPSNYNYLQS